MRKLRRGRIRFLGSSGHAFSNLGCGPWTLILVPLPRVPGMLLPSEGGEVHLRVFERLVLWWFIFLCRSLSLIQSNSLTEHLLCAGPHVPWENKEELTVRYGSQVHKHTCCEAQGPRCWRNGHHVLAGRQGVSEPGPAGRGGFHSSRQLPPGLLFPQ